MERLTEQGHEFTSDQMFRDIDKWSIAQCLNRLSKYEDAEEQGLLVKRDCNGCISDDCYECVRCGKYEDHYKSEED